MTTREKVEVAVLAIYFIDASHGIKPEDEVLFNEIFNELSIDMRTYRSNLTELQSETDNVRNKIFSDVRKFSATDKAMVLDLMIRTYNKSRKRGTVSGMLHLHDILDSCRP